MCFAQILRAQPVRFKVSFWLTFPCVALASMASSSMEVSSDLIHAINAARPPCMLWAQGFCKKGARCSWRHGPLKEKVHSFHVPHVSCNRLSDGSMQMCVRPPLLDALNKFFGDRDRKGTVGGCKTMSQMAGSDGDELLMQLVWMQDWPVDKQPGNQATRHPGCPVDILKILIC